MHKFEAQGKYNKEDESNKRQQRQKGRVEYEERQGRKFHRDNQYSNGYKKYVKDENGYATRKNSLKQNEQKFTNFRNCSEASVKVSESQAINNDVFKKSNSPNNSLDVSPPLNTIDINTKTRSRSTARNVNDLSSLNQDISNGPSELKKSDVENFPKKPNTKNVTDLNTKLSETRNSNQTNRSQNSNRNSEVRSNPCTDENYSINKSTQLYTYRSVETVKCELPNTNASSSNLSANNVYQRNQNTVSGKTNRNSNDSQNTSFTNPVLYQGIQFNTFPLINLLYYNVNLMQGQQLFDYAFSLSSRILDHICEFESYCERDELQFLCTLTDGTQTEKNQRLITTRTCCIANRSLEKLTQTLGCPTPHPSQKLHFPASNPQILAFSYPYQASNPSETVNSYSNNCESQVFEKVQDSDLPKSGNDENMVNMHPYNAIGIHQENAKLYNYNTVDDHNNAIYLAVNNIPENIVAAREPLEQKCLTNVKSEQTVPAYIAPLVHKDSTFSNFGLDNLLNYDINTMQGDTLLDYAFAIRQKILETIWRFKDPVKEKLEFLCEISDGMQTKENQKLITSRMCHLIIDSQLHHVPQNEY